MRSVGLVLNGTVLSQLIPIFGTLVLARIYDTTSFGIFSAWLGAVLFLGVVLTCRFEASLAVEADGQIRRTAVVFVLITVAIMAVLSAALLVIAALAGLTIGYFSIVLLIMIVPTAAIVSATQTLQNWAAADGRYHHLTVMRVVQATSVVLLQIVVGMHWPDAERLGFAYLVGVCVALIFHMCIMPLQKTRISGLKAELFAYWDKRRGFAIFSLPADAVSAATAQLPVLIVAARFGADAAGLLAMALRVLGAPMSILAGSVLDVFKRHAAQAYMQRGECRAEYINAFRLLVAVAAVITVVVVIFGESAFGFLFGELWLGAGTVALWLMPRFAIGFVASPLSYMVYVAGKQHLDLLWQLLLLAMSLATLLLIDSTKWALLSYSIGYGGLYIAYLFMSYRFCLGSRE